MNEVSPIVRIERNINTFIHLTNHTIVESMVVIKPTLTHHVSQLFLSSIDSNSILLALRKHMKMHEVPSSSDSPRKRTIHSPPQINHSINTDSPSQSPPAYENLAPMKTNPPTSSYIAYEHPSTSFQAHSSRLNF